MGGESPEQLRHHDNPEKEPKNRPGGLSHGKRCSGMTYLGLRRRRKATVTQ